MSERIKKILGFTLIELLAVLTIIGIISAILTPSVSNAIKRAQRAKAASNLRQVALAYIGYTYGSSEGAPVASTDNVHDIILTLAKDGHINSPEIYIFHDDPAVKSYMATSGKKIPKTIWNASTSTENSDFKDFPISVAIVSGLNSNAPADTTPIAYTRGLQTTGTWASSGVYRTDGGYIAFLDGHVQFYENVNNELIKFSDGSTTSNINEAINSDAKFLEWRGTTTTSSE